MEASRFAASAAKHTTARTGKGAGTGKGGGSGTGSGGGSVSSLRNNIFKTSAFSLSRKHMHVPPLPGIGQGSGEFDDMSYDDPGQGSGAASDQGLDVWDGPPGHAAATAKAAGKTRMEKERDEALKKTIAKKLPHNVGNSRSPLLLPPVAPAVATSVQDGIDGSPMTLKDGKGEELGFPYPPANTPMIASTPGDTHTHLLPFSPLLTSFSRPLLPSSHYPHCQPLFFISHPRSLFTHIPCTVAFYITL